MLKKLNNSLKNVCVSYLGKVIVGLLSLLIMLTQQLRVDSWSKFTGY